LERDETLWCVWYREKKKGVRKKEKPTIVPTSISIKKDGAQSHLKKLRQKFDRLKHYGYIYDYECGLVNLSASFSDITFLKTPINSTYLKNLSLDKYAVIDSETTGFSRRDQVIDLAGVKVEGGKIVDRFQAYIIPTVKIRPDAQKVHGLTIEFLKKHGRKAQIVFPEFDEWLGDYPVVKSGRRSCGSAKV
jgi:DNA polymerase III alpha subunit (gram-positive type)